jgi:CheY-like chemotaxis protein
MLVRVQESLLLLVDADRRAQRAVTRAAAEIGIEVVACDTARAGINACCALEPAGIITELELSDFDGHWLVSAVREQPSDVAVTPILVVTHEIDSGSRARTLRMGADIFLAKPIAAADLVAHARALIDMAARIRDRRGPASVAGDLKAIASVSSRSLEPVASKLPFSGTFERFPPATLLIALELEKRSGCLTLRPAGDAAGTLEIELAAAGLVAAGRMQGRALSPLAAVQAALGLSEGLFEFAPGPERPAPPGALPTGRLLSGAVYEVIATRSREEAAPPSRRRGSASVRPGPSSVRPAAGGRTPASTRAPANGRAASVRPPRMTASAALTGLVNPPPAKLLAKAQTRPPPAKPPAKAGPTRPPPAKGPPPRPPPPKAPPPRPPPLEMSPPAAGLVPPPVPRPPLARVPPPARLPPPAKLPLRIGPIGAPPRPELRPAPVEARPEADEDDVIEAENDG